MIASQLYEKQNGQNDVLQVLKDEWREYDEVEILKTPAHGCVQDSEKSRVVTTDDGKQKSNVLQYGSPKFTLQVKAVSKARVLVKTHTKYLGGDNVV